MAIKLDSVSIVGLRATHFEQLLWYIECCEQEKLTYGNREQFDKRQNEIKEWLNGIIKMTRDTKYKIPKKSKED